jgi:hypothetical protein
MYQNYEHVHGRVISSSCEHSPEQRPGQFPSWWCCRSPEGLNNGAQFALPPKWVNAIQILGEQRHRQYDAMCDIVTGQTNHWREDEIRAEIVTHVGTVAYASYPCVYHCRCFGQITNQTLLEMIKTIDEAF